LTHAHALPGARRPPSVIRNRSPTCSRPPLSSQNMPATSGIRWFVYFPDPRIRRTRFRLHPAVARLPAGRVSSRRSPKPCISADQCHCRWTSPAAGASVDGQNRPGRHDGAVTAADKRVDLQVRGVEEERAVDASGFVGLGQDGCAEVPASAAGAIEERDCSHRECGPGLLRADGHLYPRCTYLLV